FWKALAEASMLKEVAIRDLSTFRVLPCRQLTELQVQGVSDPETLFPILSECRSLQSLYLDKLRPPREFLELGTPVAMPCVRYLSVFIRIFPNDVYPLFGLFVFPSLRKLEV
ncbi:hypothetical protein L218DRAFT_845393, partial [Marasmius fiardii PR-910]